MIEQKASDTRFPVYNTKLAACLVTLGFLVKKEQPFMTVINADNPQEKQVFIFLEPSSKSESIHLQYKLPDGRIEKFKAWDFENAWLMREKWQHTHPIHPFNDMRLAIEAREWIINNFIRNSPPQGTLPPPFADKQFRTTELKFACILKALGYYLYANDGRDFVFQNDKEITGYLETYNGGMVNDPVSWMKMGLVNYELLNKRMRQPDNTPCVKKERTAGGKRRVLLLPLNCPDHIRVQFEQLFYANK